MSGGPGCVSVPLLWILGQWTVEGAVFPQGLITALDWVEDDIRLGILRRWFHKGGCKSTEPATQNHPP